MKAKRTSKIALKSIPDKSDSVNANSLQKFTEIRTKEQIKEFLDQPGQDYQGLQTHLFQKCKTDLQFLQDLMDREVYNIEKSGCYNYELNSELFLYFWEYASQKYPVEENKEMFESQRRDQYIINREIILRYYKDYTLSNGRLPTITNLSAQTGLSRATVTKHFKDLKSETYLQEILEGSYILVDSILAHLYKIGVETKNIKAMKIFLDWHKSKISKVLQENYIQINNLVISNDEIQTLPKESLLEIENIIINSNKINRT